MPTALRVQLVGLILRCIHPPHTQAEASSTLPALAKIGERTKSGYLVTDRVWFDKLYSNLLRFAVALVNACFNR
jgi:hypothetical protein